MKTCSTLPIAIQRELPIISNSQTENEKIMEVRQEFVPQYAYYGVIFSGIRTPLLNEKEFYGLDLSIYHPSEYQNLYSTTGEEFRKIYGIIGGVVILLDRCDVNGVSIGGLCDCHKTVKGIQIGLISRSKELYGVQTNVLGSIVDHEFIGIQCTPLFNVCKTYGSGLQVGSINLAASFHIGIQLGAINGGISIFGLQSAFLNMSLCLSGVQFGVANLNALSGELWDGAKTPVPGIQAGCINIGGKSNIQIGLINWAENLNGVQIGLLNFKKESWVPIPLLRISRD